MRKGWRSEIVALAFVVACAPTQARIESGDDIPPIDPRTVEVTPGDPLACVDALNTPPIANAYDARWSPDGHTLAVSRIVTIPNARMVTGYEEDQRISTVDVSSGGVRDQGEGASPSWSGYGTYLSFWREGVDDLLIVKGGQIVAGVPATEPAVRWVGDDLYFFHDDAIEVWSAGTVTTIAHVGGDLAPAYPHDDVYFSADGQRFSMTRYFQNGTFERYYGITGTGEMQQMPSDASFSEWSPTGHTLLLRSDTSITLFRDDGSVTNVANSQLPGRVHGWTADGKLMFGSITPTVPGGNAFDVFHLLDSDAVATLPNVLGIRAFSPGGRFFAGTTRTGLYPTELVVYACGSSGEVARADPTARSRRAAIDADPRRFVRPVSGPITQFVQGSHTGIDVAAPFGAVIVASDDGVVDDAGWVPTGGRRVCVMHAGDLESCDYHTSLALVSIGDHVQRGQPVALIGMTGLTFGPHVHWEAKRDRMIVDPLHQ